MGECAFFLVPAHRKSAIENLKVAFKGEKTEAEIRAIAKGIFRNLGENLFEILSAWKTFRTVSEIQAKIIFQPCNIYYYTKNNFKK